MKKHCRRQPGFTLLEILVTVFIIGLISTLAFVSFDQVRRKSRNVARLSDIRQIQAALELYRRAEGAYPSILEAGQELASPISSTTYMAMIPTNPQPRTDGVCTDSDYVYSQTDSGSSYTLNFCLGGNGDPYYEGRLTATPIGIFRAP